METNEEITKEDKMSWEEENNGELEEKKCVCGEQTTFGDADVEIGGICHRTKNPCYIISPSDRTWEESLNLIAVDVWANIHDSLKKDGTKFKGDGIGTAYGAWVALNEIFIPRTKDLLTSATIKAKEEERERITKKIIELPTWNGMVHLKGLEQVVLEEPSK